MEQEQEVVKLDLTGDEPSVDAVIAFEDGTLTPAQVIAFMQHGIDKGWVWKLQGFYGRLAKKLIADGKCHC